MSKLLSICIPVIFKNSNDIKLFQNCINSVINQKNISECEIIVETDDNSTYEKLKLFSDFFELYKIKMLKFANLNNPVANWNKLIEFAKTPYVQNLHADDFYIGENFVNIILNKIKKCFNNWFIISSINFKNKNIINYVQPIQHNFSFFKENCINGRNYYGNVSTVIFKKSDIFFDENLHNLVDLDFDLQLYNQFKIPYIINEFLIGVNIHENQISSIITEEIQQKEIQYMKEKWKDKIIVDS